MSSRINLQDAAGGLVYIPSRAVVYKLGKEQENEQRVPTDHATLAEPAVVPLISVTSGNGMAQVYYNGDVWWAHAADIYEVKKES